MSKKGEAIQKYIDLEMDRDAMITEVTMPFSKTYRVMGLLFGVLPPLNRKGQKEHSK